MSGCPPGRSCALPASRPAILPPTPEIPGIRCQRARLVTKQQVPTSSPISSMARSLQISQIILMSPNAARGNVREWTCPFLSTDCQRVSHAWRKKVIKKKKYIYIYMLVQRHHFANKDTYGQSYDLSSSQARM